MKKVLSTLLVLLLVGVYSAFACTIFAVGKDATTDGSTMISHTCDSNSDDLRIWLIPSMEAGTTRDVVVSGRAGSDFSNFPEVAYGPSAKIVDSYVNEKATNQYVHGMYSFMNDKGLAIGESTCAMSFSDDRGMASYFAFNDIRSKAKWDCYMLQDAALENCSTAREAVEFMGKCIEEGGWADFCCECINICDGNEAWIMECYGAHVWVAFRLPEDAVFVAANRARINFFVEDDPENYLYAPDLKNFVAKYNLWDGTDWSKFIPCWTFAPYGYRPYSTRREWRAMTLLNPSLDLDPEEQNPDTAWPCYVVPAEPVSVQKIYEICGDYYAGTEYDVSESIWGGQFGDALNCAQDFSQRAINSYRCTYVQIANVKAWLPEEARCLVWYGCGASDTNFLTPLFGSMTELDPMFTHGLRSEYDPSTIWWTSALVQQLSRINYRMAREDIHAKRDGLMKTQYDVTFALQNQAAKMIKNGQKDAAVALLTNYANSQAQMWKGVWDELTGELIAKYMFGAVNMNTRSAQYTDFWKELNASEWGQYK